MAILQGAVTNPNCQGLAPSPNQNAIRILQDMCNATSHSATQANGGFGSTHGGSPYDQRTTAGYGGFTPGGVQPLGQIGGFAALSRARQSQQYGTAQYNQLGTVGFAHAGDPNRLMHGSPVQPVCNTTLPGGYPSHAMRTVSNPNVAQPQQHHHIHQGGAQTVADPMAQRQAHGAPPSQWSQGKML